MDTYENINVDNLELAGHKKRLISFIIDDLLIAFITLFILWTPINNVNGNFAEILVVMNSAFYLIMLIKVVYQSFFVWYYGATLGKLAVKIRVIDFNHFGKVTLFQSFLRAVVRLLSEFVFYIGFLLSYYTQSKQTLHDKISKTLVVNV